MQTVRERRQRAYEGSAKSSDPGKPELELSDDDHEASSVHPRQKDHHSQHKVQQGQERG